MEFLNVGENVFLQRLITDIYNNVTGISNVDIKAFATNSVTETPNEFVLDYIDVGIRGKAVFSESRIEVLLIGN